MLAGAVALAAPGSPFPVEPASPPPAEHPYAPFLRAVEKPSRYVGGEHGAVQKDWDAALARVCLAFPDVYEIGMSHLGFKILYGILNGHEKLLAERAYAPWVDMEAALRAHGEPLRSLESARPLRDFDVVGFSLQFELTYTNVLQMLDLGGIPLRASARGDGDPLVVVGGPVATHAEPLSAFFDCAVIGDGEEKTPELALTWAALGRAGVPRRERLRALASLGGVYVPSLYATEREPATGMEVVARPSDPALPFPIERAFVEKLDAHPFPAVGPVSATESIFDRVSVEIARGCTEGCRFCQAGMIYRPVRERSPESILATIEAAVRDGGYDEASLTSLSTADYSAIHPLVRTVAERMEKENVAVSVSSLRAYGLDEDLLDDIRKVRASGLTFAPEAGTQRMRDVVNKNVTEEQLMTTAERVFSRGWSKMKLYFMIGLPTEEEEDVRGICRTAGRARDVGRRVQKGRPEVTASVSIHVPKPHTPFQWCAMDPKTVVLEKQGWLRDEARAAGVKLKMHPTDGSWLEGVLARGDRTLGDAIEHAYRAGARFDSWEERHRWELWQDAFRATEAEPDRFLRTLPVTARLPWDHVSVGLEEGFLAREYRKALSSRLSPPCGKAAGMFVHHTNLADAERDRRRLVCYDCGVACDLTAMREERAGYLTSLGALAPPPARTSPEAGARVEPIHRRPPPRRDQGEALRVRLAFRKLGRAAFEGHLDLVRLMPRVFRRAGLPLFYSQGFHPKPEMVFSMALPLGVSSLGELVDLKLVRAEIDEPLEGWVGTLAARLNAVTEPGIEWTGARLLGPTDPAVSKILRHADYVAGLPRSALLDAGLVDEAALRARIAERLADRGALVVVRSVEGIGKKMDVGTYLEAVEVGKGADVLAAAGIVGALVPIAMRVLLTGQGTAKATEAVEALLGVKDPAVRVVRARLSCDGDADPMDLDAVRAARVPQVGEPGATAEPHAASAGDATAG